MDEQVRPLGLLISLHPRWAAAILTGAKTVELRRRGPHLASPLPTVLYATAPVAMVVGHCVATAATHDTPDALWQRFGPRSGMARYEWDHYVRGAKQPACIELGAVSRARVALGFRSPQSWCWLRAGRLDHEELLRALDLVRLP